MRSIPDKEVESWRSWWEKRHEQVSDYYELIRGAPDLLSNETKMFLANKLISSLELRKGDTLLDAGCGIGESVILLGHQCHKVIGIDYANTLLSMAAKRCGSQGIDPVLICASVTDLPLRDDIVDKLICISVFQYIPNKTLGNVLKEFYRVTRTEGLLVVHCKNNFNVMKLYELYRSVLDLLCRIHQIITKSEKNSVKIAQILTAHYRSYRYYRHLLKSLGEIEEEWSSALFPWPVLKRFGMNRIVERFELATRRHIPFLLRPFGIEYYFKIRVRKEYMGENA